jgi:stalled ribosome rescue protein Dom34
MTMFHAVVLIDRQQARILQFDAEHLLAHQVRSHSSHARFHGDTLRSEHEYFGEVCDALVGISEVLVAGSHATMADFHRFLDKHRPQIAAQVVGFEPVDHPSERQLVALARNYFLKSDRMAGVPTPS